MNHTKPVMFDPLTLGKRAQRIRIEKELSIESLAKAAGVNKNTVVRFEKGISTRMETIYKICSVLEVSPLHLMEGRLIKGRDYDIRKHETDTQKSGTKRIPRTDRVQLDMCHGMTIGDLNYRLPEGQLGAKVMEIFSREIKEKKTHPGEELLFCLTGTIGIEISDVTAVLKKGDAIFFWGTEPHCYFNADENKDVSVALSVVCGGD
ncbi:helix-turn-helix transcriptional regulator [bacterium]|nr:helix-turn-helix transcriptional regulator [bacterium]